MIFTRDQVFDACKRIAPKYNFDVSLIQALCMQECTQNKQGNFLPDRARLEPNFYLHYTEVQNVETTNECLYAISFGIMQMMGQSLKEIGYFQWFFDQQADEKAKEFLGDPLSEITVPKAINYYCVTLDVMIDFGCQWLVTKRNRAGSNIVKMLGLWNGDLSGKYADEVLMKQKIIKGVV